MFERPELAGPRGGELAFVEYQQRAPAVCDIADAAQPAFRGDDHPARYRDRFQHQRGDLLRGGVFDQFLGHL